MKAQPKNENEHATVGELSNEELDQVSGGNVWAGIAGAAAGAKIEEVTSNLSAQRARTPNSALNQYIE